MIGLIWFGLVWFVCAVHKQRDIVPLDVNDDTDDSSDEDDVQPVFDLKVLTFPPKLFSLIIFNAYLLWLIRVWMKMRMRRMKTPKRKKKITW